MMAWIYHCIFYILLFQASVRSFGIIEGPASQRIARSANAKSNGSYKIINRFGKPFVNKRVAPEADGSVVFPGLTSRSGEDSLQVPDECKDIGICEYAPADKDDLVRNVIKDYQRRNKTFNSDVLEHIQIAERIGPAEDNVELCASKERLFIPKMARDSYKKWHRIINTDDYQLQRFRIEICNSKAEGPCSNIIFFEQAYEGRCVQKYVMRHMVALDSNNEVVEQPFPLPSCCSCVAKVV